MTEAPTADPISSTDESAETPSPDAAAASRKPFSLAPKTRLKLGPRTGQVRTVRGNRDIPYEVEIRFEGEKYPQWFQYHTLRLHWEKGILEIL